MPVTSGDLAAAFEQIGDLLDLPGLGPERVRVPYEELHVHSLPQLLRPARDGGSWPVPPR